MARSTGSTGAVTRGIIAPGAEHRVLDFYVGLWDVEISSWLQETADGEPAVSDGTVYYEWINGGLFLSEKLDATLHGEAWEGLGIIGYNQDHEEYQAIWVDNRGTAISLMKGHFDHEKRRFSFDGLLDDPEAGEHLLRQVNRIVDDDHHFFEWQDLTAGCKMMEIMFTRHK